MKPKSNVWYYAQPMGINTLSKIVNTLVSKIGLQGRFSNHSCRATAASRMYQGNCEEQLVMEKTGHRSNAVRSYKRTSDSQLRGVSKLLYGQTNKLTSDEPAPKKECTVTSGDLCNDAKPPSTTVSLATANETPGICVNVTVNVNK